MNKSSIFMSIMVFTILIGFSNCTNPKSPTSEAAFVYEPYGEKIISNTKLENLSAFIAQADMPTCASIPTQEEVKTGQWTFTDHFYSASQALKIGIPIVNGNLSHDLKVYVKDYRRISPCTANDNSTVLLYGQVIRTVIEIENYDASIGVDLASIAANGTLKKNTQHFYFYKDGFFNPKIDAILATVQGKTFDVENYALYQSVLGDMINLLREPNTTFSVNKIGIQEVLDNGDDLLVKSPIVSYTLMSIYNKNSCDKTKSKFPNNKKALDVVESIYKSLETPIGDEKPTDEAVLKAKKFLQGVKVRN